MYLCHAGSNPTGDASKISIIENKLSVPASVCANGFTVTFRTRWFDRVFSDRTMRTALACPTTRQLASKKQNSLAK